MGVLNATPDSFYDGGAYVGERAAARVGELASAGAFVIDVGGESTRPGAPSVSAEEQLERIEPAVRSAVSLSRQVSRQPTCQHPGLWISVDTSDPLVAETVLGWGAHIINDVSCLADPGLARVVARASAALLLMHARGPMAQMRGFSDYPEEGYRDVVSETAQEWQNARDRAIALGVAAENILFDPGIGFAKNARQSMELLLRLDEFESLGAPVVVGPSRKSFLNLIQVCSAEKRLGATIASCLFAAEHGAKMVRVHDVSAVHQALLAQRLFGTLFGTPFGESRRADPVGANPGGLRGIGCDPPEGACSKAF
jgi:dihydropteroate synthase